MPTLPDPTAGLPADAEAAAVAALDAIRGPQADPARAADLALAVRAAIRGGDAACRYYGGPLEIAEKGAGDPVTAADRAADRTIRALLEHERPEDPILSEESPPPPPGDRDLRLWIVDPLDGTREFIAVNGEFSTMVGLAGGGSCRLGAVYQPAVGRVFAGDVEGGAWVLSRSPAGWVAGALEVSADAAVPCPIRFVRSRSHPDERIRLLAERLGDVEEVISGSVGIKCALVAQGAADLYVHPVPFLKEWDTCAPEAVLRGAGGRVTDCAGEPLTYGHPDPRQRGGIFAATRGAWVYARPIVIDISEPLFEGR